MACLLLEEVHVSDAAVSKSSDNKSALHSSDATSRSGAEAVANRSNKKAYLVLLGVLFLASIPFLTSGYWVYTLGISFANAIVIISVSFLVRYGGEVSIGHGVFMAIGAYTVALAEKYFGVSLFFSLPIAVFAGVFAGVLFSFPVRFLTGIYLAVATMALALALPEILLYFSDITGGYEGMYVELSALPVMTKGLQQYYLPLVGLILVALLLAHFRKSRQAMSLLLMRTSVPAAESFGIRLSWARMSCMGLSAGIAAFGGGLLAFGSSTVSPNSFTLWTSIFLLVGSVVSLYSLSVIGSLIGGLFLTLMPLLLAGAGDWIPILYGVALLGVILIVNTLPKKWRSKIEGGH